MTNQNQLYERQQKQGPAYGGAKSGYPGAK